MEDKVHSVSELTKNRFDLKIIVRITRLWFGVRRGLAAENAKLEAIGLDQKGDHIHIEIDNEDVPKFKCLLKEGNVYSISKFAIKSDTIYRPVLRNVKLVFTSVTEVVQLRKTHVEIPKHKFEFEDYQVVHDAKTRDEQLFDLIGVYVEGVEPTNRSTVHGKSDRTYLTIQDLSGKQCKVTLWGDISKSFNSMEILAHEGTKILIFTSMFVRHYISPACASSTAGTKIYVNLDYPEVTRYLQRYGEEKIEPVLLPFPIPTRSKMDDMVIIEKTVNQLFELPTDKLEKNTLYVCRAKIVQFELDNNWYYLACEECKKFMWTTDEGLQCRSCKPKVTAPIPWYKIEVEVEDSTGRALFVHFGRAGDDLVGMPISTLLTIEPCDKRLLHPRLKKLENTILKFGVVVNPKSVTAAKVNFNVLKIFKEEAMVLAITPSSITTSKQIEAATKSLGNEAERKNDELEEQETNLDDYDDFLQEFESQKKGIITKDAPASCPTPEKRMEISRGKKLKQVVELIDETTHQSPKKGIIIRESPFQCPASKKRIETSRGKKLKKVVEHIDETPQSPKKGVIIEESPIWCPAPKKRIETNRGKKLKQVIELIDETPRRNIESELVDVEAGNLKRRKFSSQIVFSSDSNDEKDDLTLAQLFSRGKVRKSAKQFGATKEKGSKRKLSRK